MEYQGFIGTYTTGRSEGIYTFDYDHGRLSIPRLFATVKNPKYICFFEDKIAAVCDMDQGSGIAIFNQAGEMVDSFVYEDTTSCYITYQNHCFYTANYHEGTLSIVSYENKKFQLEKQVEFGIEAGCHQVLFYEDEILVPCLKLDTIQVLTKHGSLLAPITFPKGSGCRHGVFSDDFHYLYVVGELNNHLYVVNMEERRIVEDLALIDDKKHAVSSAAIKRTGDYLIISMRGLDAVTIVEAKQDRLKQKTTFDCFGHHPRDLEIQDDLLFVANRDSDSLNVFDIQDGFLHTYLGEVSIPEGVCVIVRRK